MPRFEPLPDRRPAIVAGASSGIGAATAIELAAHGFPVALGARRVEKCQEIVDQITSRRRRGDRACALDVTDPDSVKDSCRAGRPRNSATSRCWSPGPVTPTSASCDSISTDEFESQIQIHLIGANRVATAVLPGMIDPPARRPDLRRIRRRAASAPAHGRLRRRQGGAGRHGHQPADGTRGHRSRASIVHPGPTKTNMGWSLPAELIGPALEDWAKWGQARHDYFLRAADLGRAITFVAETPRGGYIANMELQPEAPLADHQGPSEARPG